MCAQFCFLFWVEFFILFLCEWNFVHLVTPKSDQRRSRSFRISLNGLSRTRVLCVATDLWCWCYGCCWLLFVALEYSLRVCYIYGVKKNWTKKTLQVRGVEARKPQRQSGRGGGGEWETKRTREPQLKIGGKKRTFHLHTDHDPTGHSTNLLCAPIYNVLCITVDQHDYTWVHECAINKGDIFVFQPWFYGWFFSFLLYFASFSPALLLHLFLDHLVAFFLLGWIELSWLIPFFCISQWNVNNFSRRIEI